MAQTGAKRWPAVGQRFALVWPGGQVDTDTIRIIAGVLAIVIVVVIIVRRKSKAKKDEWQ